MARVLPTVDQIDRGLVLCIAGARAHLAGQAGRARVAGGDDNHNDGGGRSLAGGDLKPRRRRTGVARVLPTVDQIDRGLVLRIAGARAHLVGQPGGAGVV